MGLSHFILAAFSFAIYMHIHIYITASVTFFERLFNLFGFRIPFCVQSSSIDPHTHYARLIILLNSPFTHPTKCIASLSLSARMYMFTQYECSFLIYEYMCVVLALHQSARIN